MTLEEEIARTIDKALDGDCGYGVREHLAAALMPLVRRAQADKVREAAELVMDPRDGPPFNADHDLAIVSAWLDEMADRIEQNSEGNET